MFIFTLNIVFSQSKKTRIKSLEKTLDSLTSQLKEYNEIQLYLIEKNKLEIKQLNDKDSIQASNFQIENQQLKQTIDSLFKIVDFLSINQYQSDSRNGFYSFQKISNTNEPDEFETNGSVQIQIINQESLKFEIEIQTVYEGEHLSTDNVSGVAYFIDKNKAVFKSQEGKLLTLDFYKGSIKITENSFEVNQKSQFYNEYFK